MPPSIIHSAVPASTGATLTKLSILRQIPLAMGRSDDGVIWGASAAVWFAGMTPGFIGLMPLTFQVPRVSGNVPMQVSVGGTKRNEARCAWLAKV